MANLKLTTSHLLQELADEKVKSKLAKDKSDMWQWRRNHLSDMLKEAESECKEQKKIIGRLIELITKSDRMLLDTAEKVFLELEKEGK